MKDFISPLFFSRCFLLKSLNKIMTFGKVVYLQSSICACRSPGCFQNIIKRTVTKIKNITDLPGKLLFPLITGNSKTVRSEAELMLLLTFTGSSWKSFRKFFGFGSWQSRCSVFLFQLIPYPSFRWCVKSTIKSNASVISYCSFQHSKCWINVTGYNRHII